MLVSYSAPCRLATTTIAAVAGTFADMRACPGIRAHRPRPQCFPSFRL